MRQVKLGKIYRRKKHGDFFPKYIVPIKEYNIPELGNIRYIVMDVQLGEIRKTTLSSWNIYNLYGPIDSDEFMYTI